MIMECDKRPLSPIKDTFYSPMTVKLPSLEMVLKEISAETSHLYKPLDSILRFVSVILCRSDLRG